MKPIQPALIFLTCILTLSLQAQEKLISKKIHLSLVPGIGSNGFEFARTSNRVSFNILSGYSANSTNFELAGLSNYTVYQVNGIQIAGLFNVTGRMTRKDTKVKKDEFDGNLYGFQFAGLGNAVKGGGGGAQVSGLFNSINESFDGFQFSGLFNQVGAVFAGFQLSAGINRSKEFALGIQFSGLINNSAKSFQGLQLTGLMNYTGGALTGYQIGSINRAQEVEGKFSKYGQDFTSIQIGLFNSSSTVNGFQIGLINLCRTLNGYQIGLINLSGPGDGKKIGLLNVFSNGEHVRVFVNETFLTNIELSTGSRKPLSRRTLQNNLLFSYNPDPAKYKYGIGYGIGTVIYSMYPQADGRFFHYDAQVTYVNEQFKFSSSGMVVGKLRTFVGKRLFPKMPFYIFGGLSVNGSKLVEYHSPESYSKINLKIHDSVVLWLGYSAGIQIH